MKDAESPNLSYALSEGCETVSSNSEQIIGVSIVCLTVGLSTDQRKHQSSESLALW